VELSIPAGHYGTPSERIEIFNPREKPPLPGYLPTASENDPFPLRLMTAPTLFALNASFYEQEELRRRQGGMLLQMNPAEARTRALRDGERVIAWNFLGEVAFLLRVTPKVPRGVVVAEGVWWLAYAPGSRSVNALTSQRLTDRGEGSTFYDNRVDVRKDEQLSGSTEGQPGATRGV
jgi:anaerobic selenocysteine-containing dehydrogenase